MKINIFIKITTLSQDAKTCVPLKPKELNIRNYEKPPDFLRLLLYRNPQKPIRGYFDH